MTSRLVSVPSAEPVQSSEVGPRSEDIAQIVALKARYMDCVNSKAWEDVRACLTTDASVAYEDGRFSFDGPDAIIDYLRESLDLIEAKHAAANPRIRMTGPCTASGLWELRFQWHDPWDNTTSSGTGVYSDRYTKTASGWLISFTGFVVTTPDS